MMRRTLSTLLISGILGLSLALPAFAGKPHLRTGFTLGGNLGGGSGDLNSDGVETDRESGGAGNLRVGYGIQDNLVVGAELNLWTREVDEVTWTFDIAAASVTWYPSGLGFYLRGGFGVGQVKAEVSFDNVTASATNSGIGFLAAMGHEWRLTDKFALGPQVDFGWTDVGDGLTANFINLTLGVNWYFFK